MNNTRGLRLAGATKGISKCYLA